MQAALDFISGFKKALASWLLRGSSTTVAGTAAGVVDPSVRPSGSDMTITVGRPPDLPPLPAPPLHAVTANNALVPVQEDLSETKELLKDFGIRLVHNMLFLGLTMWIAKRLLQWAVDAMDPTSKEKEEAQNRADRLLNQIGIKDVKLNELELALASNLVNPSSIRVGFEDVGGLDEVIEELGETVILPLKNERLFKKSKLLQPPKGVLLYGPPGCGKTMIAKATAKEAGARFLNINLSSLLDKWYGESQKRVEALFSLALKIQPTIIFIDEMDSILRGRNATDHEATAMMKTQFMSHWDGLSTDTFSCRVIIMGATNRPSDLDEAIMRRMPLKFYIGMPNANQRLSILKIILEDEDVDDNVDLKSLAKLTDRFSGSDLKELCRNAAVYRVREFLRSSGGAGDWRWNSITDNSEAVNAESLRPISNDDLARAVSQMSPNKIKSGEYLEDLSVE